jgi:hypothetical protein
MNLLPIEARLLPVLVALVTALALAVAPTARAQSSAPTTTEAKQSPPPAGAPARGLRAVTTVEGIQAFELSNGMQLLLVPDASKPTTTFISVSRSALAMKLLTIASASQPMYQRRLSSLAVKLAK